MKTRTWRKLHTGTLIATVPDASGLGEVYIYATHKSGNRKTGNVIQIWILPASLSVHGDDSRVCFNCEMRPAGQGGTGTCYVDKRAIGSMVRKIQARRVNVWDGSDTLFRGRSVRFGAWGDPVLIPLPIVERIVSQCRNHTGYTHQWSRPEFQGYRKYFMASTNTLEQCQKAVSLGWRYFLVPLRETISLTVLPVPTDLCPAVSHGVECNYCNRCNGANDIKQRSIYIQPHGSAFAMKAYAKHGGKVIE